jgi:hypothetical protein
VAIPKLLRKVIMINEFLTNESFEVPVITSVKQYINFTDTEKSQFKWLAGGNTFEGINYGPSISDGNSGFNFPNFINGEQALAMQRNSFIEQSMYLSVGTYVFSMYFISRRGTENNPILISLDGAVLTTLNQLVTSWTLFTSTFNVLEEGNKLIRLEGTSTTDLTTGIDLVAVARKQETITPFSLTSSETTIDTYEGVESYKNGTYIVSNSSQLDSNTDGYGVYSTSGNPWYSAKKYANFNGEYLGTVVTTLQDGTTIRGEYLQIELPFMFSLSSYELKGENGTISNNRTLPINFYMVGSLNNEVWVLVDEYFNPDGIQNPLIVENPKSYIYYRIIVNATQSLDYTNISFLKFTGN